MSQKTVLMIKRRFLDFCRSIVLDYDIAIHKLRSDDRIFEGKEFCTTFCFAFNNLRLLALYL